jgi:hypothetical protein
MSGVNSESRDRAIIGVALLMLMSGCASNIGGSEEPPFDWVADSPSERCTALSGRYLAAGMPAPANSHTANYGSVWPTEGSLLAIVEQGSNARPRKRLRLHSAVNPDDVVLSMTIIVDASGKAGFEAKNASGRIESLSPREWSCDNGTLTSLAALNSANAGSYVRLWKRGSALIAEQTIRPINASAAGTQATDVVRLHFKFASAID